MSQVPNKPDYSSSLRRWLKVSIRIVIALIVSFGVGRRIWLEREKLAAYDQRPQLEWLAAAGLSYLVGLLPCAAFWWLAMRDRGARPAWTRALAAYYAGHLGKYVPGKGMVVVVRAGMMRDSGVELFVGAITCVHETALMMGTGALAAAILLPIVEVAYPKYLLIIAASLAAGLGGLALPPVVLRLERFVLLPLGKAAHDQTGRSRWRTVIAGAAMIFGGWLLIGVSLAAVLASMHELTGLIDRCGPLQSLCLLTAVVALATVGGFVSLTPGGLGAREWILVETLGPVIGAEKAVIAAVLLRIAWIVAEAVGTGFFWIVDGQCKKRRLIPN